MNDEDRKSIDRDELHDRLVDAALREVVGGERPPDLAGQILAAARSESLVTPLRNKEQVMSTSLTHQKRSFRPWLTLAAAACVLAAGYALLAPSVQAPREAARSSAKQTGLAAVGMPAPSTSTGQAPQRVAAGDAVATSSPVDSEASARPPLAALKVADVELQTKEADGAERELVRRRAVDLVEPSPAPATPALARSSAPTSGGVAAGEPALAAGTSELSDLRFKQESLGRVASSQAGRFGVPSGGYGYGGGGRGGYGTDLYSAAAPGGYGRNHFYAESGVRLRITAAPVPGQSDAPFVGEAFGMSSPGRGLAEISDLGAGQPGLRRDSDGIDAVKAKESLFALEQAISEKQSRARDPNNVELRRLVAQREQLRKMYDALQDGRGPGEGGDKYARIVENDFKTVSAANTDNRLSTFSIDVDTASYANVREFLLQSGTLPPPDAVRIEELVNYFDYDYSPPTGDVPFAAHIESAACPWNAEHRLVRIGIKGREMENKQRPSSNLVFLVDISGSMDEPNKLPLLIEGMKLLTRQLGENDRVAIVVYASSEGLALDSTRGDQQATILGALDKLHAGGSTAGGAGIQLAYKVAADHFVKGGTNRVILCTDGDFNVGVTSPAELERMAEEKAKSTGVFLTVLGFGRGNLNDAMMERIADRGNGNYHYVDGRSEARKVLVEEMTGTLVTIAKDVKIQVEFNPSKVAGYRLIGYENRVLAAEDFNDDKKDAGEIGAGHTVTALYEIVPAGQKVDATKVDELKYEAPKDAAPPQPPTGAAASAAGDAKTDVASDDLLTLKMRYKQPDGDVSTKLEFPFVDNGASFADATGDFKFASAVASFGMLLRDSAYKGNATYASVLETAESTVGDKDPHGYRREFVTMVERAKELSPQE